MTQLFIGNSDFEIKDMEVSESCPSNIGENIKDKFLQIRVLAIRLIIVKLILKYFFLQERSFQ